MFRDAESLIQEGLQLSPVERLRVADRLYDSVPDEDEVSYRQEFMEEAKRRLDEYRRGEGTNISAEESLAKGRAMIENAKRAQK